MADFGIGDPSEPKATDSTGRWSVVSLLKGILDALSGGGGGGGASQVEGTVALGDPATANPLLMGYKVDDDSLEAFKDDGAGAPSVAARGAMGVGGIASAFPPVAIGYADISGNIAQWADQLGDGAPSVTVINSVIVEATITSVTRGGLPGIDTFQADVTTSSAVILSANASTFRIFIQNMDTLNPIYIRGAAVSATNGYRIAAGQSLTLESEMVNNLNYDIYGIAVGGTVRVSMLRQRYA